MRLMLTVAMHGASLTTSDRASLSGPLQTAAAAFSGIAPNGTEINRVASQLATRLGLAVSAVP